MANAAFDAVVVGAGIIGTSTAYALSQRGLKVLAIDALAGAGQGATSSSLAMIRTQYSTREGTALAWEGYHCWKDWPAFVALPEDEPIAPFHLAGVLTFKTKNNGFLEYPLQFSKELGIPFTSWPLEKLRLVFPTWNFTSFGPPVVSEHPAFATSAKSVARLYDSLHDPALRDTLFHHMVFGFPDGGMFLSLPMPGPDDGPHKGNRRCHFVWFRSATDGELTTLCTDATGKQHGLAIPPPLIRSELISSLKRDADALLAPQLAALVHRTRQVMLQPIFDLESEQLAFGRVALLGDAAFVARPHVATGVMKAALDAQALADRLAADSIDAGLAHYDSERCRFGHWLVERGRHIGRTMMAQDMNPEQRIDILMREYGAAGVVNQTAITAQAAQ